MKMYGKEFKVNRYARHSLKKLWTIIVIFVTIELIYFIYGFAKYLVNTHIGYEQYFDENEMVYEPIKKRLTGNKTVDSIIFYLIQYIKYLLW